MEFNSDKAQEELKRGKKMRGMSPTILPVVNDSNNDNGISTPIPKNDLLTNKCKVISQKPMLLCEVNTNLDGVLNDAYVVDYTLENRRILASIMIFELVVDIKVPNYLK